MATVTSVEPTRTPADSAASPLAMAVVATDAISQGASPMAITPSRSDPAATMREAAHDSAGRTVAPATRATTSGCQAADARRRASGLMVTAVANTSTARMALTPWCRTSHRRGDGAPSPTAAATSTVTSSGYPESTWRSRAVIQGQQVRRHDGRAGVSPEVARHRSYPATIGQPAAPGESGRGEDPAHRWPERLALDTGP